MATAAGSPLTDLSTVLQNLFLGRNSSTKETSTVSSRADASIIERLQGIMDEAVQNSNNPSAVQPIVDKIIKDATIAFAPTLAREASGGGYNSTVRQMLASQAAGDATAAASSAVLNYKTQQQQIANQAGASLVNATKTTTSSGNNKQNAAGAIPGGISGPALGALGLYTAYKNKDKIINALGFNDLPGWADITKNSDLYDTVMGVGADGIISADTLPAWADITQSPDLYNTIMGPSEVTQFNFADVIGDLPQEALDWGGQGIEAAVGDIIPTDGFDITSLFGDIGDGLSGIFDEILNFF